MANSAVAYSNPLAVLDPPKKEPRLYTLAEYLRKEENAKELHEYYDGQIIKLPMAKGPHNIIVYNTGFSLGTAFIKKAKDFTIFGSQQLVYSQKFNTTLYPDILVVAEEPIFFDKGENLLINPILIIEVLSRSTRKYDLTEKFTIYKSFDSLREYVTIDPKKCLIRTNFREEPDLWREKEYSDRTESVVFKSVGCEVPMDKIYWKVKVK